MIKSIFNQLKNRFKKLNPTETIILWIIISLIVIPITFLIAKKFFDVRSGIIASILVFLIILMGRFYNMEAKSFVAILSIFLTAGTLSLQNETLRSNLKQLQLNTRPQLIAKITPRIWNNDKESFFGGNISFENFGAFPAKQIKPKFLLQNDTGRVDDFKRWYAKNYGAFPEIAFVPPKSSSEEIPLAPSIPKNANFACIGILIQYQGLDPNKRYWYLIRKTYRLIKDKGGNLINLVLINDLQESDDDTGINPPNLEPPVWKDFLYKEIPD